MATKKAKKKRDFFKNGEQLLALVAHELRNPLNTIQAGLRVLERCSSLEQVATTRDMMERQLHHAMRLVHDLLDVGLLRRGKLKLSMRPTLISEIVAQALETSRGAIKDGNHSLKVSLPQEPVSVMGDGARLAQALINLLDNASRHCPDGSYISLSARQDGQHILMAVSDSGPGLAQSHFDRVFDAFHQIEPADGRSKSGLGVGLFIVRMIVEGHGGKVRVTSGDEAPGATFTITLPAAR